MSKARKLWRKKFPIDHKRRCCVYHLQLKRSFTSHAAKPNHFDCSRSPWRLVSLDHKNLVTHSLCIVLHCELFLKWLDSSSQMKQKVAGWQISSRCAELNTWLGQQESTAILFSWVVNGLGCIAGIPEESSPRNQQMQRKAHRSLSVCEKKLTDFFLLFIWRLLDHA